MNECQELKNLLSTPNVRFVGGCGSGSQNAMRTHIGIGHLKRRHVSIPVAVLTFNRTAYPLVPDREHLRTVGLS